MDTETQAITGLLDAYRNRLQQLLDQATASGGVESLSLIDFNTLIDAQDRIISYCQELGLPSGIAQPEVDKLTPYLPPAIDRAPTISNEDLLDHLRRLELIHRRNLAHLNRQKSLLNTRHQDLGPLEVSIKYEEKKLKETQDQLY